MNAVLAFIVVSVATGVWSASTDRPLPRWFLVGCSALLVLALYSRRVI